MKDKIFLEEGLKELNIDFNEKALEDLLKFKDILLEWNKKINLTSIIGDEEFFIKHLFDSATCLTSGYIKEEAKIIDIGTGAGFPGLVLKMLSKEISITLLDSLKKRTLYLEYAVNKLGLDEVEVIHGRAEDYGNNKDYREKYDIALSRAVASLNVLLEYCLPFVKTGGYFLCQKGPSYREELKESKNALRVLGGECEDIMEFPLPKSDIIHYILVIKKIFKTPTKYPRKAGKPAISPLK